MNTVDWKKQENAGKEGGKREVGQKQAVRGLHGLVKRDRMRKLDCRARDGVKAGGNLQNETVVGQADWNGAKPFGELKSGNEVRNIMEGKAVYKSYTTNDANLR